MDNFTHLNYKFSILLFFFITNVALSDNFSFVYTTVLFICFIYSLNAITFIYYINSVGLSKTHFDKISYIKNIYSTPNFKPTITI